ncbi:hypothetical protein DYB32_002224 [Aphanomyces invadans]|uniref:CRAL-TRIO domain-containing protein n=1 Tax=Aphanomyces invadans TaxID=157072 RepID=A0A3R6YDB6_9STRA|nr:hypothetical protein DYB32_002224 [Aphanomyces invadans]
METERTRRVSQHNLAIVHNELLRAQSKRAVVVAMEAERARRMSHDAIAEVGAAQLHPVVEIRWGVYRCTVIFCDAIPSTRSCSSPKASAVDASNQEESLSELPVASTAPDVEKLALRGTPVCEYLLVDYDALDLRETLADVLPALPANCDASKLQTIRLLRFLRGHKGNVDAAAAKYRANVDLRQKYNLDTIRDNIVLGRMTVQDFPHYEKIRRYVPAVTAYDIEDDSHNVLAFEKVGAVDVHGLMVNVSEAEWLTFALHELELRALTLDQRSLEHRTLVCVTVLRDLDGFSLTRLTRPALARLQRTVSLASTCYPESVHKSVFVNTPLWLDDAQRQKTVFLTRGDASGATEADIRPRDVLTVPFRMNANDTLCWEFCVAQYDVDFLVKFRTQGDGGAVEQSVEGWDKARFVHGQVEAASWTAPSAGVAVLCWDNSFSWTRGKTLCYKASVAKPSIVMNDMSDDAMDLSGHTSL